MTSDLQPAMYLIVADETEEFANALRYAALAAQSVGAGVAVLYIIEPDHHWSWGSIEARVRKDTHEEAEKFLDSVAQRVLEISGVTPTLFIQEGKRSDALVKTVKENPAITRVILGANTKAGNPGPLVSYFTGKGVSALPVPLTIVPDHIPPATIDRLARGS